MFGGTSRRRSSPFAPSEVISARPPPVQDRATVAPVGCPGSVRTIARTPCRRYASRRRLAFESRPRTPTKAVFAPSCAIWRAKFVAFPPGRVSKAGMWPWKSPRGRGRIGGVIRSTIASPTATTRHTRRAIPSGLPESLPFQFFDDELVVGGTSAVGTEETAVRVPHGIGTLPSAEPAEGVGHGHDAPQKKSSSVSFFSALRGPSGGAVSPAKSPLSRDFCCAGWVPVKRAFSSHPYTSVMYARVCATRRA